VDRRIAGASFCTWREAATCRSADAVRLAHHRPGHAVQPGICRARAEACREDRQDSRAEGGEWRKLLESIPTDTVRGLRDRALIATLTYSFARIGAALKMKVEDLRPRGSAWTIRLHEKGGKEHAMPCHHALAEALHAYIAAAGIAEDRKGFLFRTARGHTATALSEKPMVQSDAWRMIRRRAAAAGINASIGNHSFRATGITAYLANGGALEHAQEMAAHESPRTTKLYDRTKERLTQDEVERIRL
jgi:integrase